MEELADVDEVGRRGGARDEHAGHPADRELGAIETGAGDLGRDVRPAFDERHLEPFRLEIPLGDGGDIAGELRAEPPTELHPDRREAGVFGRRGARTWRRRDICGGRGRGRWTGGRRRR
jgi:hypothetical protein